MKREGTRVRRQWNPELSKAKANATASRATAGAAGGGGAAAFLIVLIRTQWPDFLPWSPEHDQYAVGMLAAAGAAAWGWFRTFAKDKEKHGG